MSGRITTWRDWVAVAVLGVGSFTIVTTELAPIGGYPWKLLELEDLRRLGARWALIEQALSSRHQSCGAAPCSLATFSQRRSPTAQQR